MLNISHNNASKGALKNLIFHTCITYFCSTLHCLYVYTIESLKCKIRAIDGAGWQRYNCPVDCLVEYRIKSQTQWKLKLTRNLQQPHWLCSVTARVYGAWLDSVQCMQDMMNENGFAIYANLMLTMYYSTEHIRVRENALYSCMGSSVESHH